MSQPPPSAEQSHPHMEGERRVFVEHYEQWSAAVYRYLVHLVGRKHDAEDLFQETWARALEHRDQLRDSKLFSVWIFRIARNLAFNEVRKGHRKGQVWIMSNLALPGEESGTELLDRLVHPGPNQFDQTLNRQRREIVQRAIAELDLASQEMLQLRYFEDFSLGEIAELLNVPLGTVCTKIHRGLKAIQEQLKTQGIRTRQEI